MMDPRIEKLLKRKEMDMLHAQEQRNTESSLHLFLRSPDKDLVRLGQKLKILSNPHAQETRYFQLPPLTEELCRAYRLIRPEYDKIEAYNDLDRSYIEIEQNSTCFCEAAILKNYQQESSPQRVLEIGPGLGRSAIYFARYLGLKDAEFILYDDDGEKTKYTVDGPRFIDSFCGNLSLLRGNLEFNAVKNYRIVKASSCAYSVSNIEGDFDLIYSFYAVGYHWSLREFYAEIKNKLHKGGMAFFNTHPDVNDFSYIDEPFEVLEYIDGAGQRLNMVVIQKGRRDTSES